MNKELKAVQKNNIVADVYEQIKEEIINGNWEPGQKIPSEHELSSVFNVSRTSVRSAIQKLRDTGFIITRHGKGSFVTSTLTNFNLQMTTPIFTMSQKDFLDIIEFRESIEMKCMELVVVRADEEDIHEIEKALNEMIANHNDYSKYSRADFSFHYAIVKASKNNLFIKFMDDIKDFYYYHLEELNRVFGNIDESIKGHINQFEAIKNRDMEAIKRLIKEGIEDSTAKALEQLKQQNQ